MLQYYMTIIAYTYAAIIGYGRFIWNLSKLYSRHINFYCKKLTQVVIRYGLLNVVQYVNCIFFLVYNIMVDGSVMVTFIQK